MKAKASERAKPAVPAEAPVQKLDERPSRKAGKFRHIGGSQDDVFNMELYRQAMNTAWLPEGIDRERQDRRFGAIAGAMSGVHPKDEVEGMLAAQMVAAHNAAMECYRRAMLPNQSFEGRQQNLAHAAKLSRTYVAQIEGLKRYRAKPEQKITVVHQHVQVNAGQAVVGVSSPGAGVGAPTEAEDQSHAKNEIAAALGFAPGLSMRSEDAKREAVPVAGGAGPEAMPHARRHE